MLLPADMGQVDCQDRGGEDECGRCDEGTAGRVAQTSRLTTLGRVASRAECRLAVPATAVVSGAPAGLPLPAHLSASSSQLIGQLTAQLTAALKVTVL